MKQKSVYFYRDMIQYLRHSFDDVLEEYKYWEDHIESFSIEDSKKIAAKIIMTIERIEYQLTKYEQEIDNLKLQAIAKATKKKSKKKKAV